MKRPVPATTGWFSPKIELIPSGAMQTHPPFIMIEFIARMPLKSAVKFFLGRMRLRRKTVARWLLKNSLYPATILILFG